MNLESPKTWGTTDPTKNLESTHLEIKCISSSDMFWFLRAHRLYSPEKQHSWTPIQTFDWLQGPLVVTGQLFYYNIKGCTYIFKKSSSSALTADMNRVVQLKVRGEGLPGHGVGRTNTTAVVPHSGPRGPPLPLHVCVSWLDAECCRHVTERKQGSWYPKLSSHHDNTLCNKSPHRQRARKAMHWCHRVRKSAV